MTTPTTLPQLNLDSARGELRRLGCYGLAAQAQTLLTEPWLARVIEIEAAERARRSLKRRLDNSRVGAFKPIADSIGTGRRNVIAARSRSCSLWASSKKPPTCCSSATRAWARRC